MVHAGGSQLAPAQLQAHSSSWLHWEAASLRPALLLGNFESCVQKLEAALAASGHLVGSALSVADIAAYSTLLPLHLQQKLSGAVKAFMEKLGANPAVQAATEQVQLDGCC